MTKHAWLGLAAGVLIGYYFSYSLSNYLPFQPMLTSTGSSTGA